MYIHKLLLGGLAAAALSPASAMNFDFGDLTYSGGINAGFLPTDGISCTSGDLCSSNVDHGTRNGDLTYTAGGMTVKATGSYLGSAAAVVQDHDNAWAPNLLNGAGLGVYHQSNNNSDDNITSGETLTLSFDHPVTISDIGLRADGHNVTNWAPGATFLLDGVSTALPLGSGEISGLHLTGTTFTFAYGGLKANQFYLSSINAVQAVPEPASAALLMAGLGMLGLVRRRRTAR